MLVAEYVILCYTAPRHKARFGSSRRAAPESSRPVRGCDSAELARMSAGPGKLRIEN